MTDSFSEVTNLSWFSRIVSAIKGILVGLVMVVAAFVLLFWNEGRAVKLAKDLASGAATVITIPADRVDSANNQKLVHLTADAKSTSPAADPTFALSLPALRLARRVEMFQWQERKDSKTEKNLGGGSTTSTSYSYQKVWHEGRIDSADFNAKEAANHANPALLYASDCFNSPNITVGAFDLPSSLVSKIPAEEPVPLSQATLAKLPQPLAPTVHLDGNTLYLGKNPASPELGDLRISFKSAPAGTVSLVAQQAASTFQPYQAPHGNAILLLQTGSHSAAELFAQAQHDNIVFTWILRGVGFLLFFFGFLLVLKPFAVLADVVPFLGGLVGFGSALISLPLAACLSFLTIAIAWLFYRPFLAILLLVLAALALIFFVRTVHGRSQKARALAPTQPIPR